MKNYGTPCFKMVEFKVDNLKNMNALLRGFAEYLLSQNIAEEDVFLSRLVSCELISNVIMHGGQAAEFKGELMPDKISITVTAECQKGVDIRPAKPPVFAEGGRGIYIINAVSLSGLERGEGGELRVYIKRTPK